MQIRRSSQTYPSLAAAKQAIQNETIAGGEKSDGRFIAAKYTENGKEKVCIALSILFGSHWHWTYLTDANYAPNPVIEGSFNFGEDGSLVFIDENDNVINDALMIDEDGNLDVKLNGYSFVFDAEDNIELAKKS